MFRAARVRHRVPPAGVIAESATTDEALRAEAIERGCVPDRRHLASPPSLSPSRISNRKTQLLEEGRFGGGRRVALRLPSSRTMRGSFQWVLLLSLASFAGCGASCKKGPDSAVPDDEAVSLVDLPGVDTSSLIASEKRLFSKVVHDYSSPCGDPVTLEVCVKESRPCKKCLPAARTVAQLVPKGEDEKAIRDWLDNRFDDKSVKSIDLSGTPSLGPSGAPIVIVEIADFECPHCGAAMPIIHSVIDAPEFKGKVRFLFKEFPLNGHEHAEAAARAAIAAMDQGKFWEMHDQLFTHQEQLNPPDIEGYAKRIGLDVDKWRTAMASPSVKERVQKERDLGGTLGVAGTPTLFIDGRKFMTIGHEDFADQLRDWLRLDLQLGASADGKVPAASVLPASVSASALPSAKASP